MCSCCSEVRWGHDHIQFTISGDWSICCYYDRSVHDPLTSPRAMLDASTVSMVTDPNRRTDPARLCCTRARVPVWMGSRPVGALSYPMLCNSRAVFHSFTERLLFVAYLPQSPTRRFLHPSIPECANAACVVAQTAWWCIVHTICPSPGQRLESRNVPAACRPACRPHCGYAVYSMVRGCIDVCTAVHWRVWRRFLCFIGAVADSQAVYT